MAFQGIRNPLKKKNVSSSDAKPKNYASEKKNSSYLKIHDNSLPHLNRTINNTEQAPGDPYGKKASCRGKQTSTEVAMTWTNFLDELLRAAA